MFHSYDRDNSGTINQQELKAACKEFGKLFSDAQLRQIMDTADADKSGELEYEEFVESIESELGQVFIDRYAFQSLFSMVLWW